jgi:hypothetical protein
VCVCAVAIFYLKCNACRCPGPPFLLSVDGVLHGALVLRWPQHRQVQTRLKRSSADTSRQRDLVDGVQYARVAAYSLCSVSQLTRHFVCRCHAAPKNVRLHGPSVTWSSFPVTATWGFTVNFVSLLPGQGRVCFLSCGLQGRLNVWPCRTACRRCWVGPTQGITPCVTCRSKDFPLYYLHYRDGPTVNGDAKPLFTVDGFVIGLRLHRGDVIMLLSCGSSLCGFFFIEFDFVWCNGQAYPSWRLKHFFHYLKYNRRTGHSPFRVPGKISNGRQRKLSCLLGWLGWA